MSRRIGTVVVGAGPAGLATSERLAAAGHDHVVLERGRIGHSWRTQRWDSFRLNTPNWMNGLHDDPDGFATAPEYVASLERRAAGLPIEERAEVGGVWRRRGGGYLVAAGDDVWETDHVVAASGTMRVPNLPSVCEDVTGRGVEHLHTSDYRRPGDLPDGAVLVVGSGQSGAQIALDVARSGRRVLLATSTVPRVPRRYRGRDIMEWARDFGMLDQPTAEIDPAEQMLPQILVAGGESLSIQSAAREGVEVLGRVAAADGSRVRFSGDAVEHAAFADASWDKLRGTIDGVIAQAGIDAPAADDDIAPLTYHEAPPRAWLDLHAEDVHTVIWSSGFRGEYGWLRMPILDERGRPLHRGVQTPSAGLFVIGAPYLSVRTSGGLWGIEVDAAKIANAITGVGVGVATERVAA
jgi:putative flavoprotein involved in K+ transport